MTAVTALSKGEVVGNAVSAKPVASSGSGGGGRRGDSGSSVDRVRDVRVRVLPTGEYVV